MCVWGGGQIGRTEGPERERGGGVRGRLKGMG